MVGNVVGGFGDCCMEMGAAGSDNGGIGCCFDFDCKVHFDVVDSGNFEMYCHCNCYACFDNYGQHLQLAF